MPHSWKRRLFVRHAAALHFLPNPSVLARVESGSEKCTPKSLFCSSILKLTVDLLYELSIIIMGWYDELVTYFCS